MSTDRTISIQVSPEAAKAFREASPADRKKLELLLSLRLLEVGRLTRPLEQVMREISRSARKRGLRPDMLTSLLEE
jgi:hypothetical protein